MSGVSYNGSLIGFRMWIEYLESCSDDSFLNPSQQYFAEHRNSNFSFYSQGTLPERPCGPLAAGIMGTSWVIFIKNVISSCEDKQKVKDLKNLIDQNSLKYHNIDYLYETLRKARCKKLSSHNPEENKLLMDWYVKRFPDDVYLAFFLTCTKVTTLYGDNQYYYDMKKLLEEYGCTFMLISICEQEIYHVHGVLIFAWPVSLSFLDKTLKNFLPTYNKVWNVQPIFTDVSYAISYIQMQEVLRKVNYRTSLEEPVPVVVRDLIVGSPDDYKFKFTPLYFYVKNRLVKVRTINIDEVEQLVVARSPYEEKYFQYTRTVSKSPTIYRGKKRYSEMLEIYKECGINEQMDLLPDTVDEMQRPVLVTSSEFENSIMPIKDSYRYLFIIFIDKI